ncbi:MAG: hypothetical protein QM788_05405 [Roseateles sp.]
MHAYLVTIAMPDGSRGEHHGIYACGCDAICAALDFFPSACRISARRVAA